MGNLFTNQPQLAGNKVLVAASRNTSQTLTVGVAATLLYNLVAQDPRVNYNPANGGFTASVAGTYRYRASVLVQCTPSAVATPAQLQVTIFVNGIAFMPVFINQNMSAGVTYLNTLTAEATFNLGPGGVCSTQVIAQTGSGTALVAASGIGTGFYMEYIQPVNA